MISGNMRLGLSRTKQCLSKKLIRDSASLSIDGSTKEISSILLPGLTTVKTSTKSYKITQIQLKKSWTLSTQLRFRKMCLIWWFMKSQSQSLLQRGCIVSNHLLTNFGMCMLTSGLSCLAAFMLRCREL